MLTPGAGGLKSGYNVAFITQDNNGTYGIEGALEISEWDWIVTSLGSKFDILWTKIQWTF